MSDYETMIAAMQAAKTARRTHEACADRLWPLGSTVEWRGQTGWRSGLVIATAYGRRLFVEDAETGRVTWIGIGSLRSRTNPDIDIATEAAVESDFDLPLEEARSIWSRTIRSAA